MAGSFALAVTQSAASKSGAAAKHRDGCGKQAKRKCLISVSRRTSDTAAPTVSWKAPAAGATVKGLLRGSVCEVAASDNRAVTRVVYKVDSTTLNTELFSPWTCIFDTTKVTDGAHTLTAIAYDAAGNSSSASRAVTISNGPASAPAPQPVPTPEPAPAPAPQPEPAGDTTAPSVSWQAPTAGATVKGNVEGTNCVANASDASGIDYLVMKVDGDTLNKEISAPWNCHFDSTKVTNGSHTLSATAYDDAGNSRTASVAVNVANVSAPASTPTPAPDPSPEPAPAPSPSGMIVGLDAGNYGSTGATDVRGAVNTVRYETERGASGVDAYKKAGLRIQMNFSGPYNSGGVCALNATSWVTETLSFYKANTTPTQSPTVEVLNEPGGTWFWGSNATSNANATCYRELLKKTYNAFHGQYGDSAPKILGTLDGAGDLSFGKAWVTSDWRTYVDGFIVHPYGGTGSKGSSALGNRARIESARAMTGGPIYITEVGWPTAISQSATGDSLQWTESEQATNLTNFIAWCKGTGYVAEVIYFNYRDFGTRDWYGVLRTDGSRKPSYEALRQAAVKYGS
ncbi:MAG TPA: Ig-like domain-containing protein [Solirubrobacterales bacterium]